MTKKEQAIYDRYQQATATELRDVYTRWSQSKQASYDNIKAEMLRVEGHDLKILSANTFQYSCAYMFEISRLQYLVYHTANNKKVIRVNRIK